MSRSPFKTVMYIALPVLVMGALWWHGDSFEAEAEVEAEAEAEASAAAKAAARAKTEEDALAKEKANSETEAAAESERGAEEATETKARPAEGASSSTLTNRTEVRPAGTGRGRGLFATCDISKPGEVVVRVRPALTLLFEPFCASHCLGCCADLHVVPGRQCHACERFAVCRDCDVSFDLYEWHGRGECRRWGKLPPKIRQQQRLDVLWLLVRYRSALEEDVDFADLSAASDPNNSLNDIQRAVAAAAEAAPACHGDLQGGGEGGQGGEGGGFGKEPVRALGQLQANAVAVPDDQLRAFSALCDLDPETIKGLIFRLRTNAGAIHGSDEGRRVQLGCALSTHLSCLNHSCAPNAAAQVQDGHLVVTALTPIAAGDEMTICYVDPLASVTERRGVLGAHYGFECDCPRCLSEIKALAQAAAAIIDEQEKTRAKTAVVAGSV